MADTETDTTETQTNGAVPPQPQLRILGQFIRDMSFENIVSRGGITGDVTPDISVQVSLDAKKRPEAEDRFEVVSKFKVTSKNKGTDDTLFLLELEYGGLFSIQNVPQEQMHPFLLIECPRMLFPFVRRIVSDITHDGGFPPLNLDTIDFVALYRQGLAQRQAAQQAQAQAPIAN
ncbi:preprotein translocase subunit SecB [Oceaniovalibus guishaninsula JLT2003]|uniref:Protein-export protein SecB n=1 Tax=Oceaniovalibus guishaninsula JLT2003 TaxID=1231392 RepID=K2HB44_9RHOB|nr:protein-export chaperone SecB [Oceaniovalibus guishaninsula]EKE44678.1 preprotein translocase subunit SecB [Oceaniovalibus guishaninsula JLT2003]